MYFRVEIQGSLEKVIIPLKWIKNMETIFLFNYGVSYMKKRIFTVFIHADQSREPDFNLDVLTQLNLQRAACYEAKILKCCGKYFIHIKYYSVNCLCTFTHLYFLLGGCGMDSSENKEDLDDSFIDAVQDLLQSSESEIEWSDEELPRPKK